VETVKQLRAATDTRRVRVLILCMVAAILATAWLAIAARARRQDPNWSPKRDLLVLGTSAAVTIFLALPLGPHPRDSGHPVGSQIVLWLAFWLVLASAIRLLTLMRARLTRRRPSASS
jgi:predicted permease